MDDEDSKSIPLGWMSINPLILYQMKYMSNQIIMKFMIESGYYVKLKSIQANHRRLQNRNIQNVEFYFYLCDEIN